MIILDSGIWLPVVELQVIYIFYITLNTGYTVIVLST